MMLSNYSKRDDVISTMEDYEMDYEATNYTEKPAEENCPEKFRNIDGIIPSKCFYFTQQNVRGYENAKSFCFNIKRHSHLVEPENLHEIEKLYLEYINDKSLATKNFWTNFKRTHPEMPKKSDLQKYADMVPNWFVQKGVKFAEEKLRGKPQRKKGN
ncbi:uncharacterized protein LOC142354400 [Convolutriloba macropyga]|uniref:uncharacterized protein LOC142354400 n=1 Tax=Convolutriloba macropyga TaxID=536237 RepID=UPI003F51EFB9